MILEIRFYVSGETTMADQLNPMADQLNPMADQLNPMADQLNPMADQLNWSEGFDESDRPGAID
jgi:hypothetical protein